MTRQLPGHLGFELAAVAARVAKRVLRPDEPCGHPGCLSHISHPCEGCGRTAGQYPPEPAAEPAVKRTDRVAGQLERCLLHVRDMRSILDAFEMSLRDGVDATDARGAAQNLVGRLLTDSAVLDALRRRENR